MAITNFIPTIWSESIIQKLNQKYVCVANCNREFEGEIREKGSVVKVCGVNNITVQDYTKNTNIESPETLVDVGYSLRINTAKYFNFQIDDIDRTQAMPNLMDAALRNASAALASEAEKVVYQTCAASTNIYAPMDIVTPDTIVHEILAARTRFCNTCGCMPDDIVLEVSPRVAAILIEAKVNLLTNNNDTLETGYLGSIGGCKIYVSTQVTSNLDIDNMWKHTCIMRTKRAVAFAEQLSEVEAYRPELRFSDAVKGLHLYGCAIMHPTEVLKVVLPTDTDADVV